MNKLIFNLVTIITVLLFSSTVNAYGLLPDPNIQDSAIYTTTTYDDVKKIYEYRYLVENPDTNTTPIWKIKIDTVSNTDGFSNWSTGGYTIPYGSIQLPFYQYLQKRLPLFLPSSKNVVSFGQEYPIGWTGGFGKDGFANFSVLSKDNLIQPGSQKDGFVIYSGGPPSVRKALLIPDWLIYVKSLNEIVPEELNAYKKKAVSFPKEVYVVGPGSAFHWGYHEYWDYVFNHVEQVNQVGWILDNSFYTEIVGLFNQARSVFKATSGGQSNGSESKVILNTLLQLIANSNAGQRTTNGYDVLYLNIKSLIDKLPDATIPFEESFTLTPKFIEKNLGDSVIITVKAVNIAYNNDPIVGLDISYWTKEGPNNIYKTVQTNDQGIATLEYKGTMLGQDVIEVGAYGGEVYIGLVDVVWVAAPDMVIPYFIPPILLTKSGNDFYLRDQTANRGRSISGESVTRYYLSPVESIDITTAYIVGERIVPSIGSLEINYGEQLIFTMPVNLPEKYYYFAACADADNVIIESNETNNCSFNQIDGVINTIVPIDRTPISPPVCSAAIASKTILWPPNHKLQKITITGVTNPGDDSSDDSSSSHDSSGGTSSSHDSSSGSSSSHDSSGSSSHDSSSSSSSSHVSSSSHDSSSSSHETSSSSDSSSDSEDESGDDITIKITSIQQDEPVNGLGDGDTSPDGFGVGTSTAKVRAERSGLENGRIYIIGFEATNEAGASCTGSVTVGVPHDKKSTPIDSGARYDSTLQ